ncbi:long-chain-fatty-acid--CoA ligase FadD [Streptococcus iniae]|uniref:long-chain-fatty-acid--CoA ligase FadD n=1 Tax=Streptococcus iniae TaxID=1346 RepID=UPI002B28ED4D|nr:AMP-binding protein [Streptococcus iniae]WNZ90465.1 AMP-binding protein [Streptococcus iniae]
MDVDFLKTRARFSSQQVAIRDPLKGKEWTYEDLNQRAVNLAHYLLAYGISKGDRVALFCPNDIAYFDLLFACTKIGAVLVPINWRLKPIEIKKILEDCHPKIVFFASNHKDRLEKLVPDSQMVDVDDMEYDLICETKIEKELPFVKVDKYSPAFIMYTSGSTGMPKGVMISHNGMIQNAMNGIVNWNFKMSDRTLVSAPMFHIVTLCGFAIPFILNGSQLIIERYFNPREAIELISDYKITHLFMVPTMYYTLLTHESFYPQALESVKVFISGGAPASDFVQKAFKKMGHTIINSYGLTEVGPNNFRILPEEVADHPKSIGKPIMFVRARIVDKEFQDVKRGDIGELILSGEHVCLGYWENSAETQKAFHGNYFCTGDLARQDQEGFYYIVNRKKELIITGGENVLPSEVEAVLNRHPLIKDSIVVGFDNAEFGESVGAAIQLEADFADYSKELNRYCLEHLAGYKAPKAYLVLEDFPRNAIGKIDKGQIQKWLTDYVKRHGQDII